MKTTLKIVSLLAFSVFISTAYASGKSDVTQSTTTTSATQAQISALFPHYTTLQYSVIEPTDDEIEEILIKASEEENVAYLKFMINEAKKRNIFKKICDNRDPEGNTLLMGPSAGKYLEILELILAESPDVNNQGKNGCAALHNAVHRQKEDIIRRLILAKADVNKTMAENYTPLMMAAQRSTSLTELLLGHKANVHSQDIHGRTPLLFAVLGNTLDAQRVKLLLHAKADRDHRNERGWTALDYANTLLLTETDANIKAEVIQMIVDLETAPKKQTRRQAPSTTMPTSVSTTNPRSKKATAQPQATTSTTPTIDPEEQQKLEQAKRDADAKEAARIKKEKDESAKKQREEKEKKQQKQLDKALSSEQIEAKLAFFDRQLGSYHAESEHGKCFLQQKAKLEQAKRDADAKEAARIKKEKDDEAARIKAAEEKEAAQIAAERKREKDERLQRHAASLARKGIKENPPKNKRASQTDQTSAATKSPSPTARNSASPTVSTSTTSSPSPVLEKEESESDEASKELLRQIRAGFDALKKANELS